MPASPELETVPELERALARVAMADERLLATARSGYARTRSAVTAGAVAVGVGVALIGILVGPTGRRKLASGVVGLALPVLASAVADAVRRPRRPLPINQKENGES